MYKNAVWKYLEREAWTSSCYAEITLLIPHKTLQYRSELPSQPNLVQIDSWRWIKTHFITSFTAVSKTDFCWPTQPDNKVIMTMISGQTDQSTVTDTSSVIWPSGWAACPQQKNCSKKRWNRQLQNLSHQARRLRTYAALVMWSSLLSASLYFSKRGAYWDSLCRDVVGCHARALWPNGAS